MVRSGSLATIGAALVFALAAPLQAQIEPKFHGFQPGLTDGSSTIILVNMGGFGWVQSYVDFTWEKPPGNVLYTTTSDFVEPGDGLQMTLDIPEPARLGEDDVLKATIHYANGKVRHSQQPGHWAATDAAGVREVCQNVFTDLGSSLPGALDGPDLLGLGVFTSGDDVSLRIFNGPSYAPLALVLGGAAANLSFAGGILVPRPDVVVTGGALDGEGALTLDSTVPAGVVTGQQIYVRAWIVDPSNPGGYSATNAVMATAP